MKELIVEDWDGNDISGSGIITYKVDGIQVKRVNGEYLSKNGKPLYNLPELVSDTHGFNFAEAYRNSWGETWSTVSASKSPRKILGWQELFKIDPLDLRLVCTAFRKHLTKESIEEYLKIANGSKYEGLVIRVFKDVTGIFDIGIGGCLSLDIVEKLIKVKPKTTADVKILGFVKSTARSHYGMLKEFITEKGKVGIGLTRQQRKDYLDDTLIGTYIEVEVTNGYTPNGKFRHATFVRLRPDK